LQETAIGYVRARHDHFLQNVVVCAFEKQLRALVSLSGSGPMMTIPGSSPFFSPWLAGVAAGYLSHYSLLSRVTINHINL
jgi:hypothetical protein